MCKHNKSESKEVCCIYFGLYFHKKTIWFSRGYWVLPLTPNSGEDIHPYQHGVGDVTDDGVGGIMELGGGQE